MKKWTNLPGSFYLHLVQLKYIITVPGIGMQLLDLMPTRAGSADKEIFLEWLFSAHTSATASLAGTVGIPTVRTTVLL